ELTCVNTRPARLAYSRPLVCLCRGPMPQGKKGISMAQLEWSDALALDLPLMDDTHREFVDLLAAVERADDAHLLSAWYALVEHTDNHFSLEDAWMASTRFASGNCHSMQHKVVLQVMREGAMRAQQG